MVWPMSTILLTGATGNVAGATIAALAGKGHKLVAFVRDAAKAKALAEQGIELRVGDLDKPRTVEDAFAGVDTLFSIVPPGALAPYQASNALWAARRAGVKHVLRLSAIGAAHDAPTLNGRMHALSDAELQRSGLAYTIIQPHFFAQNLLMAKQSVVAQSTMYFALGEAKLPMIDVRDVGASAAAILHAPAAHAGKTYTLTGPTAITLHEVAAAISAKLGKPVKYQPVPTAAALEQMASFGLDDFNLVAMRDYFDSYTNGWKSETTTTVQDLTGVAPRGIEQVAPMFA